MKVTIVGDSFSKGYLINNSYARLLSKAGFSVLNISKNGATSSDCFKMFKERREYESDVLIVFVGVNDFYQGISAKFAYNNVKSILELSLAKKKILILPPFIEEETCFSPYETINNKIDSYDESLKELGDYHIDGRNIPGRYLDGLHMAEDFHENLSKEIIKILKEVEDAKKNTRKIHRK
ncbi:GDSL-type esterase/lipase family protein [Anaerococcus porci]|uniref:G-D-S-L family lipolytic protein n=1 Tax=Anaerococcus porci TaxID=2652269 RepID=A0A6N7VX39_9FIRM|nr:GDSL-type esterase/lipase family protein [Anaerococcus porci]MDY3005561.1 GDSL-type esterase/lipase family protein [Anaerococcus porci]MSS78593.1 G-D-S-L family lipolytic protein [Anaerococcus porci]